MSWAGTPIGVGTQLFVGRTRRTSTDRRSFSIRRRGEKVSIVGAVGVGHLC